MDKRYSKEEVVELIHEYESSKCRYSGDANVWLKVRGFIDEPTHNTPTVDKDRIERYDKPNTPSYDKVMEAIERAEERIRTNSKHILTLQQEVNTLLDDKIEGTWFTNKRPKTTQSLESMREEYKDKYTVSTWWSRLMNRIETIKLKDMKLSCIKQEGVDKRYVAWEFYPYEGWYKQDSYDRLDEACNSFIKDWQEDEDYMVCDRVEGVNYDVKITY